MAYGGEDRQKWQYKFLPLDDKSEEAADQLGDDGWELVGICRDPEDASKDKAIFIRRKRSLIG